MSASVDQVHAADANAGAAAPVKRTNYRWMVAFFAMAVYCMNYMDRVNVAVAAPSIMKELHFTLVQLGFLQTLFFITYAAFQIPWAALIENFGHRIMVPVSLASWSVFTCLSPVCTTFGSWVVVRALFGVGESPAANGLNVAIYHWFPRRERGRAVGIMLVGSKIGPALGFPVATMLMIQFGWRASFWVFGIIGLVIAAAYFLLLRTYPRESKHVNQAELEHIYDGQPGGAPSSKKELAPWGLFLRSTQFWCIGLQQGTANVVIWVFLSWLPVYLLQAHHFSLKAMGFAAMIPEAAYALGVFTCGLASDFVIGHKIAGSQSRAWFGGGGQLMCCLCLYLTAIAEGKVATIFWLSLALFFTGYSYNSAWLAASDIGGRFAGSVAGWMQCLGSFIGAVAPMLIAWVVSRWSWKAAILVTALTGIIGAISWAFVRPDRPLKGIEEPKAAAA